MADRRISINITVQNRQAIQATHEQTAATNNLNQATDKHTHLQNGLTNSFIKGNLAARAISATYLTLRDSLRFAASEAILFEHNLTKISAITGATGGTLSSLERTIRGVAVATNQSQNEIARAALEMGKIGLTGKQVEDALGGVASLARALDEDVVRAGETVVAVLNTYGIEARQADMVTNQLAYTVKASALDIESFGTAFSYVGGTAAAAGVSFEELQAAMDVLSNSGIKASTIGTQLRRIIADLSNSSSDASKVLGGKTLADYNSLADALQALADKNLSISDYTAIFGRTASSVAAILAKYTGNIRDLTEATKASEGALAPMTALMNTTLKSNIDGIKTAWAELTIEFGKSLGPLGKLVGLLKDGILGFSEDMASRRMVQQFREQDPAGFAAARAEIIAAKQADPRNNPYKDAASVDAAVHRTKVFSNFRLALADKEWVDKTKANIQQEIMDILDKDFAKQVADGKAAVGDIPFAKGAEDRRRVLEGMFKGESHKFYAAIPGAQAKLAQSLEPRNLESGLPEGFLDDKKKDKKWKPNSASNFLMSLSAGAEPLSRDNEDWTAAMENAAKAEDKAAESMEKFAKSINMVSSKKEYEEWLAKQSVALDALRISQDAVNGSIGILSGYLAEGLLSDGKDPFKGISDAFGDFAKKMAADITALIIKLLVFKAVLALVGGKSGGGFFSWGFNNQGGSGFQNFLLQSLGGQKFASGTDQIVRSPTAFIAGDGGPEKVTVTPRAKMGSSEEKGSTIIIQGDVYDYERFARKVKEAQEANRRNFV